MVTDVDKISSKEVGKQYFPWYGQIELWDLTLIKGSVRFYTT